MFWNNVLYSHKILRFHPSFEQLATNDKLLLLNKFFEFSVSCVILFSSFLFVFFCFLVSFSLPHRLSIESRWLANDNKSRKHAFKQFCCCLVWHHQMVIFFYIFFCACNRVAYCHSKWVNWKILRRLNSKQFVRYWI